MKFWLVLSTSLAVHARLHQHQNTPERDAPGIFEGDMRVTEETARKHYRGEDVDRLVEKGKIAGGHGRNLAIMDNSLWRVHRDSGDTHWEVPYAFDAVYSDFQGVALTNTHTSAEVEQINAYIVDLNAKMSSVKFVNRTNEVHYVTIGEYTGGCWSWVGRVPSTVSPQGLNLESPCVTRDTVEHELIHALGTFHEQSRTDRNDYVTINFDNIDPNNHDQFLIMNNTDSQSVPYDYYSVMHYWKRAFAVDATVDTIITDDPDVQNIIGFGDAASPSDLFQLELMYRCSNGPRDYTEFCSTNCQCRRWEGECTADDQCEGTLVCNTADFVPQENRIGNPTRLCTFANATLSPSAAPTVSPTDSPTTSPTSAPTTSPTTPAPTDSPTAPTTTVPAGPTPLPTSPPYEQEVELDSLEWVGISIAAFAGATMLVIPVFLVLVF